ncbi:Leucine-rich repeat-containing G-protein coupled receptor 4, partial [Stegodyphus mimosarum]
MASVWVISLLSLFFAFASCAPMTCPTMEDLQPCSCKRVAYGLHVICANFNSSSSLLKVFRILRDYRVNNVLLHGLYITDMLPSNLFDGLQIKQLRVEKSKLKFSQPAFTGLDDSLNVLNVAQHSMIKSKEGFSLARLTKLTELNVQSNHLVKIRDTWLNEKTPNVNTVILDDNDITEVESFAFSKLSQLKTISMADNRIKTVKRSMFPRPAQFLFRMDLSHNIIEELPSDFFVEMPSLTEVIFSGNELQTLPQATWTPVWENLSQVFLYNNKIVCDKELDWLKRYRQVHQLEGDCVAPKEQ